MRTATLGLRPNEQGRPASRPYHIHAPELSEIQEVFPYREADAAARWGKALIASIAGWRHREAVRRREEMGRLFNG